MATSTQADSQLAKESTKRDISNTIREINNAAREINNTVRELNHNTIGKSATQDRDINTIELDLQSEKEGEKIYTEEGTYLCAGCLAPLFASQDQISPSNSTGTEKGKSLVATKGNLSVAKIGKPCFQCAVTPASLSFAEDYSYGICRILATCAQVRCSPLSLLPLLFLSVFPILILCG
eukprot:Phypoly_transcript_13599.p1 GENE.Phypoly_transcript_13599~~Phypoly_transcript_13599.p1  ORF type:complete len:179 (+),score=36.16 Phypoly_transcript_13599:295-831(+)